LHLTVANLRAIEAVVTTLPLDKAAATYGIPLADLELLTQEAPWHSAAYRRRIRSAIEGVLWGALDSLGLHRVELPAELIAGWIAILVAPPNWATACTFFDQPQTTDSLIRAPEEQPLAGLTPARLYAMVVQIWSADHALAESLRHNQLAALGTASPIDDELAT
jgi:hypothetical protein